MAAGGQNARLIRELDISKPLELTGAAKAVLENFNGYLIDGTKDEKLIGENVGEAKLADASGSRSQLV